jgi:hypothetical protein
MLLLVFKDTGSHCGVALSWLTATVALEKIKRYKSFIFLDDGGYETGWI